MGINITSTSTNVTITGGITLTEHTAVGAFKGVAAAATQTIVTAGAGKSLRILSVALSGRITGAAIANIKVLNDGVVICIINLASSAGITNVGQVANNWNYDSCPVVAATKSLTISCDHADGEGSAAVTYVEV